MINRLVRLAVIAAIFVSFPALAQEKPLIEPWGYPLDAFDHETKPGDDFFRFANGHWLDTTDIASDRSSVGFAITMRERNEDRIAAIVAELAAAKVSKNTNAQLIRDLYVSFINDDQV